MGNNEAYRYAERTNTMAIIGMILSFIGFVVPLLAAIGIIVGMSAESRALKLTANNEDDQEYIDSIIFKSKFAVWAGVVVWAFYILLIVFMIFIYS